MQSLVPIVGDSRHVHLLYEERIKNYNALESLYREEERISMRMHTWVQQRRPGKTIHEHCSRRMKFRAFTALQSHIEATRLGLEYSASTPSTEK